MGRRQALLQVETDTWCSSSGLNVDGTLVQVGVWGDGGHIHSSHPSPDLRISSSLSSFFVTLLFLAFEEVRSFVLKELVSFFSTNTTQMQQYGATSYGVTRIERPDQVVVM
ncbi:hypothetical protein IFM89_013021 [Coptis chinensis]|uniref:Uncharacterized protein n=1 Tax=Coptis chinensis TaxID=261450 RepID=A0A835GYL7_9MAGN|nr:hypothetical protein IFM89_013021 [Coptis chinensis]